MGYSRCVGGNKLLQNKDYQLLSLNSNEFSFLCKNRFDALNEYRIHIIICIHGQSGGDIWPKYLQSSVLRVIMSPLHTWCKSKMTLEAAWKLFADA